MIRGNSLPSCAATVRSACCIPVRPASVEKSVNGSLRNSGSAMSLLRVLPPVPCGGLQLLSIRRMRDRRKDGWVSGNLVPVGGGSGFPSAQRPPTRLGRPSDRKVLDLLRSLGIHGERTSAATTLIAAPLTLVLVAKLHLHLLLLFLGHLRTSPCCCVPDSPSPARPPPAPEECYDGARR